MKLKCLGSGSFGNCYILETDDECLILDAGISSKDVKIALDFNITKISGVLITHVHRDHMLYAKEYIDMGIPTIKPFDDNHKNLNLKKNSKFKAKAFALKDMDGNWVHSNVDGSPCPVYGYYITHPDMGSLVYATDCEFIKWKFPDVNHFLLGTNYDMETYNDSDAKARHVFSGHLSIQGACKFLEANKTDALRNVILCHLSDDNANPIVFTEKASKVVSCPVYIAKKGLEIEL